MVIYRSSLDCPVRKLYNARKYMLYLLYYTNLWIKKTVIV